MFSGCVFLLHFIRVLSSKNTYNFCNNNFKLQQYMNLIIVNRNLFSRFKNLSLMDGTWHLYSSSFILFLVWLRLKLEMTGRESKCVIVILHVFLQTIKWIFFTICRIPLKTYALLSLLTVGTMGFSNASLAHLNYPTQVFLATHFQETFHYYIYLFLL